MTSHDVVAAARRRLGTRRVGHAGTLDPLATGVLVLLSEEATKLSPFLTASAKRYLAWVALGASTPTLDAEGPIEEAHPAPAAALDRARVEAAGRAFLGLSEQRPPAFSAVKRGGERSYAAARRGEASEPPPRPVAYHSVELLALAPKRSGLPRTFAPTPQGWRPAPDGRAFTLPPELAELPTALFSLEVAAGTYVRSFARDLGEALGVPTHLAGLVRTGAGRVDLADCAPLEALGEAPGLRPEDALPHPRLTLDAETARAVRQGRRVSLPVSGTTLLLDEDGELVAMVEPETPASRGEEGTGTVRRVRVLRAWQR